MLGSSDCTCLVWDTKELLSGPVKPVKATDVTPILTLFGHEQGVTVVDIADDLDLVVTASKDSCGILHSLRDGAFIRSLEFGEVDSPLVPAMMRISARGAFSLPPIREINRFLGYIVTYCESLHFHELYLHSATTGELLATVSPPSLLLSLAVTEDGEFVIAGGENGSVSVYGVNFPSPLAIRHEWYSLSPKTPSLSSFSLLSGDVDQKSLHLKCSQIHL